MLDDKANYSHDLKRNLSSIMAGTTLLLKGAEDISLERKKILIEMSAQCEETINLLDKLFNDLRRNKIEGVL